MIGQDYSGPAGAGSPPGSGRHRTRSAPAAGRRRPAGRLATRQAPPLAPASGPSRPRRALPPSFRNGRVPGWPFPRPGSPFTAREFTALWAAQLLSSAGDQLVQIAVAAEVYQRTRSPLAAALAYAVSCAALLTGGPLLAELAGLASRRTVLITLAAGRAGLAGLLATTRLPLAGSCALLVTAVLLGGSFSSTRASELPEVLPADRLAGGIAAGSVSGRAGQALGFLAGGLLLAFSGPAGGLAGGARGLAGGAGGVPAAVLAAAAGLLLAASAVLAAGLRRRPAPGRRSAARPLLLPVSWAEARATLRSPVPRALLVFAWLASCAVAPAAMAAPYARELHAGPVAAGLLMAAVPAGALAGVGVFLLLVRPQDRLQPLSWLPAVSCGLLTVAVIRPPLWLVALAWAGSGAGAGYLAAAAAAVIRAVPAADWGRAADLAEGGSAAIQALILAIAGLGAPVVGSRAVIAVTGLAGLAVGTTLGRSWHRLTGHHAPQETLHG